MDTSITIVAVVGSLVGAFGGAFINHILEARRDSQQLIFESKKLLYAEFLGMSRSMIVNRWDVEDYKEYMQTVSEALLLSENGVRKEIRTFANKLDDHKTGVGDVFTAVKQEELLVDLRGLEITMRKDLKIE